MSTPEPEVERVSSPDRTVSRAVVVAATPAELFDVVAAPRRHHELDGSGTVHQVVAGPERLGPGDRFTVAMTMASVPYRITSQVTAFDENARLEWRHPVGHRWRWEFDEVAPGSTRVTETWDYRDSRLARLTELTRFPAKNAVGIRRTLEKLRDRYADRS